MDPLKKVQLFWTGTRIIISDGYEIIWRFL